MAALLQMDSATLSPLFKRLEVQGLITYLLTVKFRTRMVRGLMKPYDGGMTTGAVAADVDPLSLERQVCFALAITNRAVLAVYRPLLEPLGLTHPQYLVMLTLWGHPKSSPQPLSVKQIAALLQMDSATLSPMLKRLEAVGLITRLRSSTDERTMQVGLTTKGRTLRRKALTIPPAVVDRLGVDLDELERLHDVLTGINAAALAAGVLDG
jgi:MarR family transcriptional regulator, organic hydroperoxide resistance regulator